MKIFSSMFVNDYVLITKMFYMTQTVHGERIFNCKSCNKAFKRRDHLLNHIKTIHKGLKPCKKCNVVFVNKEELRAHKMAVHLKLAPEDTAPPPLAKNTAQEVLQYMEEETPASTPAHRAAHAAAQQQQQVQQAQPVQVKKNYLHQSTPQRNVAFQSASFI